MKGVCVWMVCVCVCACVWCKGMTNIEYVSSNEIIDVLGHESAWKAILGQGICLDQGSVSYHQGIASCDNDVIIPLCRSWVRPKE